MSEDYYDEAARDVRNEQQQASAEVPKVVPAKAEFFVSPYADCGTPRVTVKYDTSSSTGNNQVWLETGHGCNWIAFDAEIADEVCATIQEAARAIRARLPGIDDLARKAGGE